MQFDKVAILRLIVERLRADLAAAEKAVAIARDTATHPDAQGSSKYETMGLEASYLAQGQGQRLVEVERALTHFMQLKLPDPSQHIGLSSLVVLRDEQGNEQQLWLAADAGGMQLEYRGRTIIVITPKSPLGKALLGKCDGDIVELSIGEGNRCYDILEVY